MTNTPVQNIDIVAELLHLQKIDPSKASKHLKISVEKLTTVSKTLSEFQLSEFSQTDSQSLYNSADPVQFLQDRLQTLKRRL